MKNSEYILQEIEFHTAGKVFQSIFTLDDLQLAEADHMVSQEKQNRKQILKYICKMLEERRNKGKAALQAR